MEQLTIASIWTWILLGAVALSYGAYVLNKRANNT